MEPVTVVVQRRVRKGHEAQFSEAMHEFVDFALAAPGHLDIHVLRSGPYDYTVVDRFESLAAREAFVASEEYRRRVHQLRELSEADPKMHQAGGLGGWFRLPGRPTPSKLRMGVVTFLGVFPLTATLPLIVRPLLKGAHFLIVNVVVTALVVTLLSWPIMPVLTRVFAPWLFPKDSE